MKRTTFSVFLIGLLALVISACAAPATGSESQPPAENGAAETGRKDLDTLVASDPSTVTLASGEVQLVEFFAFWWTTCRRMAPIVHGLENEYSDQMQFTYLDIDDPANKDLMQELAYIGRPYFVLLDGDGNILYKWSGYVPGADLRAKFDEVLNWWSTAHNQLRQ